jgi:acetyl esterase/lipase
MKSYIDALLPNTSEAHRRDPSISPFWADLRGKKLPPALFTCGSEDPLLDDSVMLGAKWGMWGNEVSYAALFSYPCGRAKTTGFFLHAVPKNTDTHTFCRQSSRFIMVPRMDLLGFLPELSARCSRRWMIPRRLSRRNWGREM